MNSIDYKIAIFPLSDEFIKCLSAFDSNEMNYFWNFDQWKQMNTDNSLFYLSTLSKSDNLVGFALYGLSSDQAHLLKIAVRNDLRKQSLASIMFKKDLSELQQKGILSIYLEVAEDNIAANRFYEKLGFEILTVKKKFYSDGSNANAMSLMVK